MIAATRSPTFAYLKIVFISILPRAVPVQITYISNGFSENSEFRFRVNSDDTLGEKVATVRQRTNRLIKNGESKEIF